MDDVATVTLATDGILDVLRSSAAQLHILLEGDLSVTQFDVVHIVIGRLEGAASMIEAIAGSPDGVSEGSKEP